MTMYSSYVTAPNPSTVKGYNLTLSSKVNSNQTNVNDTARVYYEDIKKNYSNICSYFEKLGDEFIAAKKNVSDDMKSSLQSIGKACKEQGQLCANRRKQLVNAFEFDQLEQRVQDLENALSKLQ